MFGALLAALAVPAVAAEALVVEAERRGAGVEIRARAVVSAPPALVWQVLTDYDRIAGFIPGITRSVVKMRDGHRVLVEQVGEARFFLFSFPIEVRLEVLESPPDWISSRAIGGNLRRLSGRYDIQADAARRTVELRYRGEIEPEFDLPPLIGRAAMRALVEEQFTAMVAEIERRAARK